MKQVSELNNITIADKPTYMCSSTEFAQATDAADGSTLMVVDETTHKVTGYYQAYNGYWNEL